jgi:hypothetical protein
MRKRLTFAVAILTLAAVATVVFAQRQGTNTAPASGRYLPEYTKDGDLVLPKNWRSWVYVGSPLTPDGLNDSKEGFPEYHNVYIEPGSYEIYKKTGEFPDGTIMFKELQRVLKPQQFPDGSLSEPSGRGYFPGAFNGADVTVKDSKRYAQTGSTGDTTTSIITSRRPRRPSYGRKRSAHFATRPAQRRTRSGRSSIACWSDPSALRCAS